MDETANNPASESELATATPEQESADTEQPESQDSDNEGSDLDTQGADPEFEELEIEGKKYALPKELKDKFLMQADYTRKTQELAQQREQSEAEIAQQRARVEAEKAQIQSVARMVALDEQLAPYAKLTEADWRAWRAQDRDAAENAKFEFDMLVGKRSSLVQQIQQAEAQRALQEQEATARSMQQAQEVLAREIKGWSPEVAKQLRDVAKSLGADDKEVATIRSPWVVIALNAVKQLKELQSKAAKAPTPPPATPVKTITGARATAAKDPDKMSIDEWMSAERKRLSKLGRRY